MSGTQYEVNIEVANVYARKYKRDRAMFFIFLVLSVFIGVILGWGIGQAPSFLDWTKTNLLDLVFAVLIISSLVDHIYGMWDTKGYYNLVNKVAADAVIGLVEGKLVLTDFQYTGLVLATKTDRIRLRKTLGGQSSIVIQGSGEWAVPFKSMVQANELCDRLAQEGFAVIR